MPIKCASIQQSGSYRVRIMRFWTGLSLFCRLLFPTLYHLIFRPAHRDIPEIDYFFLKDFSLKERTVFALYDVMHHLLCDSYSEITGLKVMPATRQLLSLLIDLTKCIDRYLETQAAGTVLPLDKLLEVPPLKKRIEIFRRYLQRFDREKPIMGYLRESFATYYERYTQTLGIAIRTLQFEDLLAAAQFDSGVWRRSMIEIIALFNSHEPCPEAFEDFYLFGMIGKFADDMFDLPQDMRNDRPNLVYALLSKHPDELTALQLAISKHTRHNASWWKTHCPNTYNIFFDYVEHYYYQITSKKLQFVSDMLIAPALLGFDFELLREEK